MKTPTGVCTKNLVHVFVNKTPTGVFLWMLYIYYVFHYLKNFTAEGKKKLSFASFWKPKKSKLIAYLSLSFIIFANQNNFYLSANNLFLCFQNNCLSFHFPKIPKVFFFPKHLTKFTKNGKQCRPRQVMK